MHNNYNIIRRIKERVLKNFYPVFHAPLIFDINTQSFYRRAGYVAWPKSRSSDGANKKNQKSNKKLSGHGGYFAYPEVI